MSSVNIEDEYVICDKPEDEKDIPEEETVNELHSKVEDSYVVVGWHERCMEIDMMMSMASLDIISQLSKDEEVLRQHKRALDGTKRELEDVKSRLSRLMGEKLTDNNPNIADLSDRNRPTKLAERYSELYDNQWTDAFESLNEVNDILTIGRLREILLDVYQFCKTNADQQLTDLKACFGKKGNEEMPCQIGKQLKDCRKTGAGLMAEHLYEEYLKILDSPEKSFGKEALKVEEYLQECFYICWMMRVQDPPVAFSHEVKPGDPFNTDKYKAYTSTGKYVAYEVWPALMLHENGPLLCKGVAQGVNN